MQTQTGDIGIVSSQRRLGPEDQGLEAHVIGMFFYGVCLVGGPLLVHFIPLIKAGRLWNVASIVLAFRNAKCLVKNERLWTSQSIS